MAPLALLVAAVADFTREPRALSSSAPATKNGLDLTESQENTLQCLALVFSTISVASAILAFYWFVKMRRSFRHDLVMLLIQSDMFKALWFMMYPIVTFANGPIDSRSKFCQANGFFLAVGIEASDVAVLMIAIHSALYIFKPRVSSGEGGLYPYRKLAYTVWLVYPILMASLAFINEGDAYMSDGTYCYLPVRPFWYQLALAWVPRYLIFMFILGIYASIYFYVRHKFQGFTKISRVSNDSNEGSEDRGEGPPKAHNLPQTPPLALNGLIPESRQSSGRKHSVSTMETIQNSPLGSTGGAHRFIWANLISISPPTPTSESAAIPGASPEPDSFSGASTPAPLSPFLSTAPMTPRSLFSVTSPTPSHSRPLTWNDTFITHPLPTPAANSPATTRSIVDIFTVLEDAPISSSPIALTPISQLQLTNSRGQNFAVSEMLRTRDKIRRQLRFLFIYPLVYIGMWIIPFVSHIMQYRDKFTSNHPFVLICLTTICVASQAAVDCWLFSTREKPWKHIPGNDNRSFFGSLRFWSGWRGMGKRRMVNGPGKTQDEMFREARAAYRRRDEEMAMQRSESGGGAADGVKGGRSWWEAAGLDGGMSPMSEEGNPIDTVVENGGIERAVGDENALKIDVTPATPPRTVAVLASTSSRPVSPMEVVQEVTHERTST